MKGEVNKEQGADSDTSDCGTFQNRLVVGAIMCGISSNRFTFMDFKKKKEKETILSALKTGHVPGNILNEIHITS